MKSKIKKIKRLATDPAATNGERAAATEALKRIGVALDIELSNGLPEASTKNTLALNEVTLTPIAMVTPTKECIYAPSRIKQPKVFTLKQWLKMRELTISVSLASDEKSNPQKMTCYASYGGYWMKQ